MSTGGGGGGNTTVTQTNIPDWLQDPTKRMVARGEALTGPDAQYQQYGGERVAGFAPQTNQAFQGVQNLYDNPTANQQFNNAGQSLSNSQDIANSAALTGASYQPGTFQGATYDPAQQGARGVGWSGFNQGVADQYMSPYQQSVTDVAKQKAALEGQQMMNKLGGTAAKNGAFGGARFGLEQAQGLRDIGANLSNIQVQGSQSAFDRAQQQFNADQARRAGAEQFSAGAANTAAGANMAAQNAAMQFGGANNMTAQQLAEQSRQFGADAGLRGADLAARTGLSAASQYQSLGTAGQQAEMDRLNALGQAGKQQQDLAQRNADVGYENFTNARDFDRNNLQFLSGLLRGNNYGTSQSITQPQASMASQLGGLGLGALGAYKMFGG
jgi:hypothetical protein